MVGGRIPGTWMSSERPAEVEIRDVTGHWEGDFIFGTNARSEVGFLVDHLADAALASQGRPSSGERQSSDAQSNRDPPTEMRRSTAWDQCPEMAGDSHWHSIHSWHPHSPRSADRTSDQRVAASIPAGTTTVGPPRRRPRRDSPPPQRPTTRDRRPQHSTRGRRTNHCALRLNPLPHSPGAARFTGSSALSRTLPRPSRQSALPSTSAARTPVAQRLIIHAQLLGDRLDRLPLRRVTPCCRSSLRCLPPYCASCHCSSLSRFGEGI